MENTTPNIAELYAKAPHYFTLLARRYTVVMQTKKMPDVIMGLKKADYIYPKIGRSLISALKTCFRDGPLSAIADHEIHKAITDLEMVFRKDVHLTELKKLKLAWLINRVEIKTMRDVISVLFFLYPDAFRLVRNKDRVLELPSNIEKQNQALLNTDWRLVKLF